MLGEHMKDKSFPHDAAYKNLFSNAEMVASLIRDFVPESFVTDLDFSTLERCSGSYVTDDIRERHDDIVWRVLWKEKWIYIYLLLEFQRRPDKWMAVRILNYITLLWQDLIKTGKLKNHDLLPPVFPIVLYSGSEKWTAAVELSELLFPVTGPLAAYQPNQKYFLLEENGISDEELNRSEGIASLLMRLERVEPHEIVCVVDDILDRLRASEYDHLRKAFKAWIVLMIGSRIGMDEVNTDSLDLQEVRAMLAEKMTQWENAYIQKGVLMGRTEGISLGRMEGISMGRAEGISMGESRGVRLALLDLLESRFGVIPQTISSLVGMITDTRKLRSLTRFALQTTSLEAFLEEVKKY